MEITVNHLGDVQFEVKARQHVVISDQQSENGGYDEGMTPPELMLASLGSCAGFYAAAYLKKHNLATSGCKVRVTAEKAKNPARLDNFVIEVDVPIDLDEKHHAGVQDAVHRCLVHNTLLVPPKIDISIKVPAHV